MNKNFMLTNLKNLNPYETINKKQKDFFRLNLKKLTKYHYQKSKEYRKFLVQKKYDLKNDKLSDFPFLPTNIFKEINLKSFKDDKIFKILTSSGTSGRNLSKIYLDHNNAQNQIVVLSKIIGTILGEKRLPMLIIDQDPKNVTNIFSARIAAINGFSIFGYDHTFILDEKNKIDKKKLKLFLKKHSKQKFFIFGFTSLVFSCFFEELKNEIVDFSGGILLHGGGWKKIEDKKIDNCSFKNFLKKKFNLNEVYNYYGMVEQTGSIFLECKYCSYFVTSNFSDILIRDKNFNILENGQKGLVQLFSLLPTSYPGHILLTEDIGEIAETNDCVCSRVGKRFKIYGRAVKSEIKGCSDTL